MHRIPTMYAKTKKKTDQRGQHWRLQQFREVSQGEIDIYYRVKIWKKRKKGAIKCWRQSQTLRAGIEGRDRSADVGIWAPEHLGCFNHRNSVAKKHSWVIYNLWTSGRGHIIWCYILSDFYLLSNFLPSPSTTNHGCFLMQYKMNAKIVLQVQPSECRSLP